MRLKELDKILLNISLSFVPLDNYAFSCAFEFKEKFNSISEYKGYPVYYFKEIKKEMIYFMQDPTINNKDFNKILPA